MPFVTNRSGATGGVFASNRMFTTSAGRAEPVNTELPTITGTAQVNQTLTISLGAWTDADSLAGELRYVSDDTVVDTYTADGTYLIVPGDIGEALYLYVTATNTGGSTTAQSANTDEIAGIAPANITLPVIDVTTPLVGETLTVTPGTWANDPTSISYQWQRDNVNIVGETGTTYVVVIADEGAALSVVETATNATGSTSAESDPTAAVGLLFMDLFDRADGGLGANWTGSTFAIVSENAVNTPNYSANLFQSGKGQFTGTTESWVARGSNTIQSVDGKLKVTYVNNDEGAVLTLGSAHDLTSNLTAGLWYLLRYKAYREGGNFLFIIYGTPNWFKTISNTGALAQGQFFFNPASATPAIYTASMAAGEIAWLDDLELLPAPMSSLFAAAGLAFSGNVVVRAPVTLTTGQLAGLFVKLDSVSNPQNVVYAVMIRDTNLQLLLYKRVSGTSTLLASTGAGFADGAVLELRASGTTYEVWFDNTLRLSATVTDASIASNTLHGMFGAEGKIHSISVQRSLSTLARIAYVGGSITYMTGWRTMTLDALVERHIDRLVVGTSIAANGFTAWIHLVRMAEIAALTPTLVTVDLCANHANTDTDKETCEALLRKLRVTLPDATILLPLLPKWDNGSSTDPNNLTTIAWVSALAAHYDCDVIDLAALMDAARDAGTPLSDWYTSPDFTHPNTGGHAFITAQMMPTLTENYIDGGATAWTGDIADYARLYAGSLAYEATPTIRAATSNDGETGTWTTVNSTERRSSSAGSTISWTATCVSVGVDVQSGSGTGIMRWRVDGGSWSSNVVLSTQANAPSQILPLNIVLSAGSHTLDIEVVSGTVTIRRFLAI